MMPGVYAVSLAVACLTIVMLVWREAARAGLQTRAVAIAIAVCAVGGVIGSRYLTLDLDGGAYGEKTFLGAVLGGLAALLLIRRPLRLDARVFDVPTFPLLCGGAIGRMGCLLSGCCHGIVTSLPWGVVYPEGSSVYREHLARGLIPAGAPTAAPVHPTQLYEVALDLLLAVLLMKLAPRMVRPGDRALITVAGLCAIRFLVDPLRASAEPAWLLTAAQWTTLTIAVIACGVLVARARRATEPVAAVRRDPITLPVPGPVLSKALLLTIPLATLSTGSWLTPLERAIVLVTTAGAVLYLALSSTRGVRVGTSLAGFAALLLQVPTQSSFPRTFSSLGGGMRSGGFTETYPSLFTTEDCAPIATNEIERTHRIRQPVLQAHVRSERAPGVGTGFRFNLVTGSDRSTVRVIRGGRGPGDVDRTDPMWGFSGLATFDWRRFGLTVGVVGGDYRLMNDDGPHTMLPAFGFRLGPLTSAFAEMGLATTQPAPFPLPVGRLGMGFSEPDGRFTVRGGWSEVGPYLGGEFVVRGTEIEPSVVVGPDSHMLTLLVRKRIRLDRTERP